MEVFGKEGRKEGGEQRRLGDERMKVPVLYEVRKERNMKAKNLNEWKRINRGGDNVREVWCPFCVMSYHSSFFI